MASSFLDHLRLESVIARHANGGASPRFVLRYAAEQWEAFQKRPTASPPEIPSVHPAAADGSRGESMSPLAPIPAAEPRAIDSGTRSEILGAADALLGKSAVSPPAVPPLIPEPPSPKKLEPLISPPSEPLPEESPKAADSGSGSLKPLIPGLAPVSPPPVPPEKDEPKKEEENSEPEGTFQFERIRHMLAKLKEDRLRGGGSEDLAEDSGSAAEMEAAPEKSSEMPQPLPPREPVTPTNLSPAANALLVRYRELRAEWLSHEGPLAIDHGKLDSLIRIAGSSFPAVIQCPFSLVENRGWKALKWSVQSSEVLFGFDPYRGRAFWQALVEFAKLRHRLQQKSSAAGGVGASSKLVVFSASEVPLNLARWTFSDSRYTACRRYVDVIQLDRAQVASLYAVAGAIADLESGEIEGEPSEVPGFLAAELEGFWKRITRPI
jgi:hypothetical protein